MVFNIQVEFSKNGVDDVIERTKARGGCVGFFGFCCLGPLACCTMLFALVLIVASWTFAVQALVVGSNTYLNQTSPNPTPDGCSYIVGVWLIVFGSLVCFNVFCECCCKVNRSKQGQEEEDGTKTNGTRDCFRSLLSLTIFGWLCYGLSLVYSSSLTGCASSQYYVFQMIVLFMFYGSIALMGASCLIICLAIPFFLSIENDNGHSIPSRMPQQQTLNLV